MRTLIRAELDKLRTLRSTWIVLAICALLTPGIAVLILGTHKHLHRVPSLISNGTFAISALLAGILCATAFANEYKDRTIATTFALVPARRRVVLAKAIAAMITGLLLALVATAACYGLTVVWLHRSNVTWPWTSAQLLHAVVGNIALGLALPLAGVGIAGITQSSSVAGTVVGVTWIGVSNILSAVFTFFRHYGIGAAQTALTEPTGHHYYGFAGALAVTFAFSALALSAGIRRVQLTDV